MTASPRSTALVWSYAGAIGGFLAGIIFSIPVMLAALFDANVRADLGVSPLGAVTINLVSGAIGGFVVGLARPVLVRRWGRVLMGAFVGGLWGAVMHVISDRTLTQWPPLAISVVLLLMLVGAVVGFVARWRITLPNA